MAVPKMSSLHSGYGGYNAYRGTHNPAAVTTIDLTEAVAAVQVEHLGNVEEDLFVTLDGATDPTADGTGDTNNLMVVVPTGQSRSLDKLTGEVRIHCVGAVDYQVLVLRG